MLDVTIGVTFADNMEDALVVCEKFMGCEIEPPEDAEVFGFATVGNRKGSIWFNPKFKKRSLVWHESNHVIMRLMASIGCSGEDEEMLALMTEYITEQVYRIWEKHFTETK
jgi:hypothetical protein